MSERTHWQGCWREHHECAVAMVERLHRSLRDVLPYAKANIGDTRPGYWPDGAILTSADTALQASAPEAKEPKP